MPRQLSLLFVILFFIPINNATAAKINEEGAQKLKTSFQRLLDYQKTANEAFSSVRVIYKGELEVKQENDYYSVTFPRILIKNPELEKNDPDSDITLDLGTITLDALPDEKEGYWKTLLELPSKITLLENSTNKLLSIEVKEQDTVALFNDVLGYFTKIDMKLSDIAIKGEEGEEINFRLGGLEAYTNLDEGEGGKFSGNGYVAFNGINISAPAGKKGKGNLGELKIDFSISDIKLPSLEEYQEKIMKHAKTFQSLNALEQGDSPQNIDNQSVIDMISDLYSVEMDGFSFQYSVKDLDIMPNPDNDEREFESLKLSSAFIGLGFDGLGTEKGIFNVKTGYNDLDIIQSDYEYDKKLMPQNANFDIRAKNIPYKTLYEIAQNSVKSIADNPEAASMVGIGLLMRLPAILSQSDTQIIIEQNGIENDIYKLMLDGKIATDLTSMIGFSAKFKAVFDGLDKVLSIASSSDDLANLHKTLEVMKNIGKNESGKDSYIFEFETTPQGQMLINGQDASTIAFQ